MSEFSEAQLYRLLVATEQQTHLLTEILRLLEQHSVPCQSGASEDEMLGSIPW